MADNAGYDSSDLVTQLRAAHHAGKKDFGLGELHRTNADSHIVFQTLDMFHNKIANVRELGVTEALKSKRQVLSSATEAAEMILRVDDILR